MPSRIVSVDITNTAGADNTVGTDGKLQEAARDASGWHDNVIASNATLDNSVPTPASGLGGIDSREDGSLAVIATKAGWHVVSCGIVYDAQMDGSRAEHVIRFERDATDNAS